MIVVFKTDGSGDGSVYKYMLDSVPLSYIDTIDFIHSK